MNRSSAGVVYTEAERCERPGGAWHATALGVLCTLAVFSDPLSAQVAVAPAATTPAAWERFAVRVVNGADTAITSVRVAVPAAVTVLGVEPPPGWTFTVQPATDSTPLTVAWTGGTVARGEFREFVFLGRVAGDARQRQLVFPVALARTGGDTVDWAGQPGMRRPAPRVSIVGPTRLSIRGTLAVAGGAVAIALVALALALAARAAAIGARR